MIIISPNGINTKNMNLLNQYNIEFRLIEANNQRHLIVKQKVISDISYNLSGYLCTQPFKEPLYDLIVELDKAIQGLLFDIDGGGKVVDLEIGYPNCTLTSGGGSIKIVSPISTEDFKQIILLWMDFLDKNS